MFTCLEVHELDLPQNKLLKDDIRVKSKRGKAHKKWPSDTERTEMGQNKPSIDHYLNILKSF